MPSYGLPMNPPRETRPHPEPPVPPPSRRPDDPVAPVELDRAFWRLVRAELPMAAAGPVVAADEPALVERLWSLRAVAWTGLLTWRPGGAVAGDRFLTQPTRESAAPSGAAAASKGA